jgi:hypothetical protein
MVSLWCRNCSRVRPSLRVATVAITKGYFEITVSGILMFRNRWIKVGAEGFSADDRTKVR